MKNQSGEDPLNFPIKLNNKIAALQGVVESADVRRPNGGRVIPAMFDRRDGYSTFVEERPQEDRVAFIDLTGGERSAGLDQFVSRCNDRPAHFAPHLDLGEALGRQQRQRLRPNPFTGRENLLPLAQIRSAATNKLPWLNLRVDENFRPIAPNVFLHNHRVRAFRHWRAGENAGRFAGCDPQLAINSGRLFANDALALAKPAGAGHDCIAIHR